MEARQQLLILRHAKSSWDDPALADHDRPLAPRGRGAADAMARYMQEHGITPDLVLCSTARRAVETLERVGPSGERLIEPELYAADAEDLLERLRKVPDGVPSVMLIGHNPAMHLLALSLAADGWSVEKFPTGALLNLELTGGWSSLEPGGARVVEFVRPRDLP